MAIEQDQEVRRILHKAAQARQVDLEAWESALRVAVLSAGAKALAGLLEGIGSGRRKVALECECGRRMESRGVRKKELLTMLGPLSYSRSMFQCPNCGKSRYPGDEELDIVGTGRSPGVRRMMGRAGSRCTFKEGCQDLKIYAGIKVSAKDVERVAEGIGQDMEAWSRCERQQILQAQAESGRPEEKTFPLLYICADGTGIPMTRSELQGRPGKQADGSARTREVKLGCIFTQSAQDEKGFPLRDPDSTSFVGAIEPAEAFGWRLYGEALRRGLARAERVVVLGDGAQWIRNLGEFHFPEATLIIDLYHAREHVSDLCKILFHQEKEVVRYRLRWWTELDYGNIEKIAHQARQRLPQDPESCKKAEAEINYLEKNKERMRYADFRRQGLFVGSGVVEAGCKTIIGQRLKQSGMEWSLRGANAIITLRCIHQSGRLEDYWEARVP